MRMKKHPNHKTYILALRQMTPEQRLLKAFELSEISRERFMNRLRNRFPDRDDEELKKLLLERIKRYHMKKSLRKVEICSHFLSSSS